MNNPMNMTKIILITSGVFGGLSVLLGAFAAHGLKKIISPEMIAVFKTGVDYQFYHTFAIALVGLSLLVQGTEPGKWLVWAFAAFAVGIILFSGSLYMLALTQLKFFGPITPLGGLFFIVGWVCFTLHWIQ